MHVAQSLPQGVQTPVVSENVPIGQDNSHLLASVLKVYKGSQVMQVFTALQSLQFSMQGSHFSSVPTAITFL